MRNKKLIAVGLLCGALCLSGLTIASITSTAASESEKNETVTEDLFYNDVNGSQISTDGENWISQTDYEKDNSTSTVEWWTVAEYEKWIAEQEKEMKALIGTGNGWYDGEGNFHKFTKESIAATITEYKEILKNMKNGMMYSKGSDDGDSYCMTPSSEDVETDYGVTIIRENGDTVHIEDHASDNTLNQALDENVKNGQLTQEEADMVNQQ